MKNALKNKILNAGFKLVEGEKAFIATITTDGVDRDNEVLMPQGMNSKEFEQNPVVLWNHSRDMPLGQAVDIKRGKGGWVAKAVFADRPENHEGEWFPDTVHSLIDQGVVRGVSVGLMPLAQRRPTTKDKKDFGPEVKNVVTQWKLLEFSVTPVPANAEALISSVGKGLLTPERAKSLGFEVPQAKGKKPKPKPRRKTYIIIQAYPKQVTKRTGMAPVIRRAVDRAVARKTGKLYV